LQNLASPEGSYINTTRKFPQFPMTATIIARSRPMKLKKDGTRDPFISMLLNIQKDPI
jgi:hypothetical protein